MNQIRRTDPLAEEISRITEVVRTQELPDFVAGFDVVVGEFQGDPAVWITFHLTGSDSLSVKELQARSETIAPLQRKLTSELFNQTSDRFPFFRYDYVEAAPMH